MSDPKLSIIIPTFNSEKTLKSCLESMISQTWQHFEIWLIDGNSTDNTVSIIKQYAGLHPFIQWVSEADQGIYDAMNKGISLSKGEWLYFLGSDDQLYDSEVLKNVFTNRQASEVKVIYGNVLFKHSKVIYDGKFSFFKLNDKNICHQAIFYRREIFKTFGKYEIQYKALADWALNIKWFGSNISRIYRNEIIAIYNEDGYCFNSTDDVFYENKDRMVKDNFPMYLQIVLKLEYSKVIGRVARFIKNRLY